jgi:hypothetical protein
MDILRRAKDRLGEHATQRGDEKEVSAPREVQKSKPSGQAGDRSAEGISAADEAQNKYRGREDPGSAAADGDADATMPLLDPAAGERK